MSVLMTRDKKELIVTCDCGCRQAFNICIDDQDKELDLYFFLCYMKNNTYTEYDKNPLRAFKIKMRKIWYIIRGKDYCYSDVVMRKEDFLQFKNYINQF